MNQRNNHHSAERGILTFLSVVCAALIALSVFQDRLPSAVRNVTAVVTVPVQKGLYSFGTWITGLSGNFTDASVLREENEALQAQVDTLTAENSQLVLDKEELSRLRELLDLADTYSEYETIGAHVISKDSGNWFNSFTIDKGTDDGVQVDCNVLSGSGLAGIVTAVGSNWATVRAIIDDNSNVSAMVSTTSDTCIIAGSLELIDSGTISLVKLTDEDNNVHVGDKVVTSNISEKFLPGILIGYISKLDNDANNLTKSGEITPVVDFKHMQEVLVITTLKQYVSSDSADTSSNELIDDADAASDAALADAENADSADADQSGEGE